MRMWLPNQCTWIFKWKFSMEISLLLGKRYTKGINLLVKDADLQNFGELYIAINKSMQITI